MHFLSQRFTVVHRSGLSLGTGSRMLVLHWMPKTHIPLLLPVPTNELGEGLQRSPAPSSQHIPLLPVPVQHQGTAAAPVLPSPHFALRGTKWFWEVSSLPQTASLQRSGWDSLLSLDHRMVEAGEGISGGHLVQSPRASCPPLCPVSF